VLTTSSETTQAPGDPQARDYYRLCIAGSGKWLNVQIRRVTVGAGSRRRWLADVSAHDDRVTVFAACVEIDEL
jgi:hypothetical protein